MDGTSPTTRPVLPADTSPSSEPDTAIFRPPTRESLCMVTVPCTVGEEAALIAGRVARAGARTARRRDPEERVERSAGHALTDQPAASSQGHGGRVRAHVV